jgi:hypothetical protein
VVCERGWTWSQSRCVAVAVAFASAGVFAVASRWASEQTNYQTSGRADDRVVVRAGRRTTRVNVRVSDRTSATPDRRAGDSARVGLSQSGYSGRNRLQARGFSGNYGFWDGYRHTYWRGCCGILGLWYRVWYVRKLFCRCSRVGSQERRWKAERTGAQGVLRHRGWTRGVGTLI